MSTITDIEDELVTTLATQSVTLYTYEGATLPEAPPVATLWLDSADIGADKFDQGFGFVTVNWLMRYYVTLRSDTAQSWVTMKAGITSIVTALGADRTLGGKVINVDVLSMDVTAQQSKNQNYLVAEFGIQARPFMNVG